MQETQETRVPSLSEDDPLEGEMAAHSSILGGKSRGQGSLAGYSPQGCSQAQLSTEQHGVKKVLSLPSNIQFKPSIILKANQFSSHKVSKVLVYLKDN